MSDESPTPRLKKPKSHKDLDFGEKLFYVNGSKGHNTMIQIVEVAFMELNGVQGKNRTSYPFKDLYYQVDDALNAGKEILTNQDLPF